MSADLYRKAEEQFLRLKRDLVAGRINLEQFHSALKEAKVRDHLGRSWTIGAKSGQWYFHDGQAWVQADPYRTVPETSAGTTPSSDKPTPSLIPGTPAAGFKPSVTPQPAGVPGALGPEAASVPEIRSTTPTSQPQPADISGPIPMASAPSIPFETPSSPGVITRTRAQTWLIACVAVLGSCVVLCVLAVIAVALATRMH